VIAQLDRTQRSSPTDLYGLYVRAQSGRLVPLDSVVTVEETVTAPSLPHFDRLRTATITGHLLQGIPLGEVLVQVRAIAEDVIPDVGGYRIGYSGYSERFFESENALVFAYALAVVLIYLVLAAQFESFVHPLIIMVTVPLALAGGLLGLYVTGKTMNIYSQIGVVMLIGIAAKNGVLIVEFINQLRDQGVEFGRAIVEGARIRFRPVVMTTVSTLMGSIPLMLARGPGSESRATLGIIMFWGVAVAALFTLFVVPVFYNLFARSTGTPEAVAKELEAQSARG
jgi:multidrug efflux pump